jgi:hypothetical protein
VDIRRDREHDGWSRARCTSIHVTGFLEFTPMRPFHSLIQTPCNLPQRGLTNREPAARHQWQIEDIHLDLRSQLK